MDRSIASGFFSIIGVKVLLLVVGTLTTPILYRTLGPTKFGTYSFVLSIFMVFMIFVSSGVGDGVRKFLAEDRYIQDWDDHVVGFYFRLALALALVGAAVMAFAAKFGLVARLFGAQFTPYFYLLAVLVVAAQFREFSRRALMGFGLERYSEPLAMVKRLTFVGLALWFVLQGYGVKAMLVAHIAGSSVAALAGFVPLVRRTSVRSIFRRPPIGFPRRELLSFNSMSVVLILLLTSLYNVDIIMLQPFAGSTQVGHYKAALKIAEFLWFVPVAIQTVFVHSTSELWADGAREKISELAAKATRYTMLLTAVMALGLAALAPIAVPLYFGEAATPAVTPLILLLPGALGLAVARPILAISQGNGTLRYPIMATGAAAAINLVLNLVLIPRYGMNGAAISTSVGYGSMFVFHLWSARQVGFDPLSDARIGRILLTTVVSAIPIMALPRLLGDGLVTLAVVPVVGLCVFVIVAVATKALGIGELLDVLGRFPAPIGPAATRTATWISDLSVETNPERLVQRTFLVAGVLLFVSGIGFGTVGPDIGPSSEPDDGIPSQLTTMTPDNETTTTTTTTATTATGTTTTETTRETISKTTTTKTTTTEDKNQDQNQSPVRPPEEPQETTRDPTPTTADTTTTTTTTMQTPANTTTTTRIPTNTTTTTQTPTNTTTTTQTPTNTTTTTQTTTTPIVSPLTTTQTTTATPTTSTPTPTPTSTSTATPTETMTTATTQSTSTKKTTTTEATTDSFVVVTSWLEYVSDSAVAIGRTIT